MAMTRSVAEKMAEVEADLSKVKVGLEKVEAGLEKVEAEIAKLKELLEVKFKYNIEELRLKWDSKEETNPVIKAPLARLDKLQEKELLLQNKEMLLQKKELLLLEEKKDLRSAAAAAGENQRTILVEERKA